MRSTSVRKRSTGWVVAAVCLLAGPPVRALDPQRAISQYVHEVWTTEQGLPQDSAHALLQTRDGYLWLGTEEGLVRFDGIRFEIFDRTRVPEIGDNYVISLCEDRSGALWIGTRGGGLARMRDGRFEGFRAGSGLPSDFVYSIAEGPDGALWLGTAAGLVELRDGRFRTYSTADGLGHDTVRSVVVAADGVVWAGTFGGGVARLSAGRFSRVGAAQGVSSDFVRVLLLDRAGDLWVGGERGLDRLSGGRLTSYGPADGLPSAVVYSLLEDASGTLWAGTYGGGLARRRGERFEAYTHAEGLSANSVESICSDREGSLWVGTSGGGLNRFKDGPVVTYSSNEGLSYDLSWCVLEDEPGRVWIGTDGGGLNLFEHGRFQAFRRADGLPSDAINALGLDREGRLWVGTDAGVAVREAGRFETYASRDGLVNELVVSLAADPGGGMWIGTRGGLSRFERGRFRSLTTREGLASNTVRALLVDPDGTVWAGTDGGLVRVAGSEISGCTTADGLPSNIVYALHRDRAGALWVGTRAGLARLAGGRIASLTTRQGLFDDVVFSLADDGAGSLWMSCNKGISRVAWRELEEVLAGRLDAVSPVVYGRAEGMKSRECNAGWPASWRTADGRLWFPTTRGVAVLDPTAPRRRNTLPPPVRLEAVVVDGRVVEPVPARLELAPGSGRLEVRYTALSLLAPERVRFRYRLEGLEEGWNEVGARRVAYYTNLPPGSYGFRVAACNNDGVWNETGALLPVVLAPRFYQTRQFAFGALALAATLAAAGFRLRVRQMRSREQELVRQVGERTRELSENQQRLLVAEKMASLGRLTAGIAHEMNTPVAAVRASLVELGSLVEEYEASIAVAEVTADDHRAIAGDMRRSLNLAVSAADRAARFVRSIKSQTRQEAAGDAVVFEPAAVAQDALVLLEHPLREAGCTLRVEEMDRGLALRGAPGRFAQVVTNLVTNAIDATRVKGAGTIAVRLSRAGDRVRVEIEDQGCGIAPDVLPRIFDPMFSTKPFGESAGLGLALVHDIVTGELGGTISVVTREGEGTTFTVELPAAQEVNHGA